MLTSVNKTDLEAGLYALRFIQHFLSLFPRGTDHHKIHTDCPVMIYEDSDGFFMDEEWTPDIGTGNKEKYGHRGTI